MNLIIYTVDCRNNIKNKERYNPYYCWGINDNNSNIDKIEDTEFKSKELLSFPYCKYIDNTYYENKFYKRPIIMIISCYKNINRVNYIYNYWLKFSQIPFKIIIADPNLNCDFIIYYNYIIIKCDDGYKSLPEKVIKGLTAINNLYNPDCIFKCDDDVFIYLSKLNDFLKDKKYDYLGNCITFKNLEIDNTKINFLYCGGPLYFLNKNCVKKFLSNSKIFSEAEDINTSYNLLIHNIIPTNFNMYLDMFAFGDSLSKNMSKTVPDYNDVFKINKNKTIGEHFQNLITTINRNIFVEVCGGIGNRLFQLAFIINLSLCYPLFTFVIFDIEKINHKINNFDWCKKIADNCNIKFTDKKPNDYEEVDENDTCIYSPNIIEDIFKLDQDSNIKINRYFQSEKYFEENTNKIKKIFNSLFDKNILVKYNFINFDKSYFLHIRGGDFCNNKFQEINLLKYIQECIKKIAIKNKNNYYGFIVFTNDYEYAKKILSKLDINYCFIDTDPMNTIYLMSCCNLGGICSNSTFSWWGSWFNKERDIYMPYLWFGSNYPGNRHNEDVYFDNVNIIKYK